MLKKKNYLQYCAFLLHAVIRQIVSQVRQAFLNKLVTGQFHCGSKSEIAFLQL